MVETISSRLMSRVGRNRTINHSERRAIDVEKKLDPRIPKFSPLLAQRAPTPVIRRSYQGVLDFGFNLS